MRRRKLSAVIIVLIMVITAAVPMSVSGATKFSDVKDHWAEKYINEAVSQGIIKGYDDGTFKPDNAVTRAEFISMANRTLKCTGSTNIDFNDVSYGEWYKVDVEKAVAATFVAGYEDNTFKPNNPISRQEVSVMISRFVPTYGYSGNLKSYSDYRSVDDWAYSALSKINGKGYIGAYTDGKIHPRDQLTRAQTAKILCDILEKENIVTSDTTVSKDGTKLSGKIYTNDVTVHKDLGDDDMSLENCIVLGTLYVQGGGSNSVTVNNCRIANTSVNKSASAVRVYAKGETTITNITTANCSILQTSGLTGGTYGLGFAKVSVSGSANAILRGSFPKVFVNGSSAKVNLESGTVSELTVESSARRSDITVASGSTVSDTIVNAESYFHGTGTISNMKVNADDVTYETKPRNWTIASRIDTPTQADPSLDVTFSPTNKSTKVKLDTDVTITFSTAMTKYDGRSISNSDISDFVTLRKDSSSGKTVSVNASINSSKKVITLDPTSNLETNTRYYIVIDRNSMKDTYGKANVAQSSYFDTGDSTSAYSTTFSPDNKASTISVNPTITISFSESVVKYSNGGTIYSSDVSNIIYLRKSSSSGTNISYSVSSVSSKKIVITPKSALDLNATYYVGIYSKSIKTSANSTTVPADSVYWTTGIVNPVVKTLSLDPGDTSITAMITSNVAGKAYAVVVESGSAQPSSAQIAAGQNNVGAQALSFAKYDSISAETTTTLSPIMTGLASGKTYDVWATVYSSASGTYSTPVKQSTTTTLPKVYLNSLEVRPVGDGLPSESLITFDKNTNTYNVSVNSSVMGLKITASGDGKVNINGTSGDNSSYADITLAGSSKSIPIIITNDKNSPNSYNVNVEVKDNPGLQSVSIGGTELTGSSPFIYEVSTSVATRLILDISANDSLAIINAPSGNDIDVSTSRSYIGEASYEILLPAGTQPLVAVFEVTSGAKMDKYYITFIRPQPVAPPTSQQ